jgi:hypothetical protein
VSVMGEVGTGKRECWVSTDTITYGFKFHVKLWKCYEFNVFLRVDLILCEFDRIWSILLIFEF